MAEPTLPIDTNKALRHFNMIEDQAIPVLRVFCFSCDVAPLSSIKKAFRRLAAIVHPDRCQDDPRGANRSMMTLPRAMEIIKSEAQYQRLFGDLARIEEYVVDISVMYSVAETDSECALREREEQAQKEKDASEDHRDCGNTNNDRNQRDEAQREQASREKAVHERAAREPSERERAERIRVMRRESDQGNGEAQQEKGSEGGEHASGGNDDLRGAEFDRTHEEDGYRGGPPSDGKDPSYYPSPDEIWDDDKDDCGISNTDFAPSNYIFPDEIMEGPPVFFEGDKAKDLDPHGDIEQADKTDGESYAERSNDSARAKGRKNFRTASQIRRTKQKRASKRRTMERAKLAPQAEKAGSMTWKPRRCIEITPKVGMALQFRWQCDQMIRAYTAYIAVHKGVNILQTWEKVRMDCRNSDCPASMVFNLQPRNGLWKMNEFIPHCEECRGHDYSSSGSGSHPKSFCAPAYTPLQVARAVLSEAASDPNISAKTIGALFRAKQIYRRQPPDSHYRSVRFETIRHMNASRAVDMAALEGYADLLCRCGHTVRIFIINRVEMKEQRIKAARHIFAQCKKTKDVPADATFDVNVVDTSDISDNGRYYGALLFVPNVAASYCMYGRKPAAADAAHCDGVGPQSYSTTFEVVTYDTNMHLLPLLFAHFIGPENHTNWKTGLFLGSIFLEELLLLIRKKVLTKRTKKFSKTPSCSWIRCMFERIWE